MPTSSFNDKVVITDPNTIAEMKEILDDLNIKMIEKDKLPNYTIEQAKENARKWTPNIKKEQPMSDYVFKSPLSIEEIEENFKDFDVFEGIKAGLEEALACERGTASPETFARKRGVIEELK